MIKAVLFDIDGVLLNSFEANRQFYIKLFEKAGYKPPTLKEYLPLIHFPMKKVVKEFTKASDEEVEKIVKIGDEFVDELYPYDLLKTPQHAEKILQELKKMYKLGIVTSRIKEHIYSMPPLTPLEKYFTVTVGFNDTIRHKPDPEPLLFACKSLKIEAVEAVYIGDAESDFLAAKAAGMKFILFGEIDFLNSENHTDSFKNLQEIIFHLR